MSSRTERRKKKWLYIFVSSIIFGIGYYFLNEVSTWFEVPLGVTFHVIFGCTLMSISGIYIGYSIKKMYFTKRKKRSKRIYLEDTKDEKSK